VIEEPYALDILTEQMSALSVSGLAAAANEIHVCVNGSEEEIAIVASVAPESASVTGNGTNCNSEIPSLVKLRAWAKDHPGWAVLYHHPKSVSTPRMADNWRKRMEGLLIWDWKYCVSVLESGMEAVGCHWLTPEKYGSGVIGSPFFGGNFWWARSDYVNRLPELPPDTWANRYEAETWIGRGNPRPKIEDRSPGWPAL
jgi:hypothetical protein